MCVLLQTRSVAHKLTHIHAFSENHAAHEKGCTCTRLCFLSTNSQAMHRHMPSIIYSLDIEAYFNYFQVCFQHACLQSFILRKSSISHLCCEACVACMQVATDLLNEKTRKACVDGADMHICKYIDPTAIVRQDVSTYYYIVYTYIVIIVYTCVCVCMWQWFLVGVIKLAWACERERERVTVCVL